MRVGNARYDVGTRVRVANITDPHDADLNGREGLLCRPVRDQRPIRDVGIRLDPNGTRLDFEGEQKGQEIINVYKNEFEVIEDDQGENRYA